MSKRTWGRLALKLKLLVTRWQNSRRWIHSWSGQSNQLCCCSSHFASELGWYASLRHSYRSWLKTRRCWMLCLHTFCGSPRPATSLRVGRGSLRSHETWPGPPSWNPFCILSSTRQVCCRHFLRQSYLGHQRLRPWGQRREGGPEQSSLQSSQFSFQLEALENDANIAASPPGSST